MRPLSAPYPWHSRGCDPNAALPSLPDGRTSPGRGARDRELTAWGSDGTDLGFALFRLGPHREKNIRHITHLIKNYFSLPDCSVFCGGKTKRAGMIFWRKTVKQRHFAENTVVRHSLIESQSIFGPKFPTRNILNGHTLHQAQ